MLTTILGGNTTMRWYGIGGSTRSVWATTRARDPNWPEFSKIVTKFTLSSFAPGRSIPTKNALKFEDDLGSDDLLKHLVAATGSYKWVGNIVPDFYVEATWETCEEWNESHKSDVNFVVSGKNQCSSCPLAVPLQDRSCLESNILL